MSQFICSIISRQNTNVQVRESSTELCLEYQAINHALDATMGEKEERNHCGFACWLWQIRLKT
jgi:hypothetical protein